MGSCPSCNSPSDPLDRFCGRCGHPLAGLAPIDTPLSRFCGSCGASLEADARFCRKCGSGVPEPQNDVFAGLALGNGGAVSIPEPAPLRVAEPAGETPTESIPRPTVPAAPPEDRLSKASAAPPRAARPRPKPRPTATIERPTPLPTAPMPAPPPMAEEIPEAAPPAAGFPWGGTLALLGALAVIMSAVLEWGGPFRATMPRDISAAWLLEPGAAPSGPSLGVTVLIAGTLGALVCLLGMAAPGFTFLRRAVGLLTLLIPVAFVLRTVQSLVQESSLSSLASVLGAGVLVAAAGGFLQMVARRPRRHA